MAKGKDQSIVIVVEKPTSSKHSNVPSFRLFTMISGGYSKQKHLYMLALKNKEGVLLTSFSV